MPAHARLKAVVILGGFAAVLALLPPAGRVLWVALGLLAARLFYPHLPRPLRPEVVRRGRGQRVALTFDDGPDEATPALLDRLRALGVRATFFVVGERVRRRPDLVRRMRDEGHAVGNHTFDHRVLTFAPAREVARQLDETQRAVAAAAGLRPRLFRAPHGFWRPGLGAALAARGLEAIGWTADAWDTDHPPPEVIARRALRRLDAGGILLLHDVPETVEALPEIVATCRRRGLALVTVDELLS